jgi:hypothetical protein
LMMSSTPSDIAREENAGGQPLARLPARSMGKDGGRKVGDEVDAVRPSSFILPPSSSA